MLTMTSFFRTLKVELTGRRLAFNVIWYSLHFFLFAFGWHSQQTNTKLAALNGLKYSVWTSRGAGLVLAFDGAMILVPMLRNVIKVLRPRLTWLFPADENIWFHRQVAYSLLFWTIVHTTAHYVNFINVEKTQVRQEAAWQIHYTQAGGITGHVMLLIMFLMYTTAHVKIRTSCFEAFWYTHHLAFFFMICLYTHATGCFVRDSVDPDYQAEFPFYSTEHCLGYESWRFTIWFGILYFGERLYREIRSRRQTEITKVVFHPSGVMELRFTKPNFKYKSGQWLFLKVPDVSNYQWHPFTITSAPQDPFVSVHIRQVGDFTIALGQQLGATAEVAAQLASTVNKPMDGLDEEKGTLSHGMRGNFLKIDQESFGRVLPRLRIDGPFGAPAEDVFSSEVAVLIGGGIGVTPFASILKQIWYRQRTGSLGSLKRVEFIWICKDTGSFGWFQTLLEEIENSQGTAGSKSRPTQTRIFWDRSIEIYLTEKLSKDAMYNIALNDVGDDFDPLTLLRSRTMFGRPNFTTIYSKLATAIESGSYLAGRQAKVSTYFCGPAALARSVKEIALGSDTKDVHFTFAKEHF